MNTDRRSGAGAASASVRANRLLTRVVAARGSDEHRLAAAEDGYARMRALLDTAPEDERHAIARMMLTLADHMRRVRWDWRTNLRD
jgi:hypothetical protein